MPTIKRLPALVPVLVTSDLLLTRTRPFTSRDLVINLTTGEMRVGPGLWNNLKTYNGEGDVTINVRVATTANITRATALNAGDTLDGVTLAAGDLVLVKNQSAPAENGIFVAGVTPARLTGYTTIAAHANILVSVTAGTAGGGKFFRSTGASTGTIDSTSITFGQVAQESMRFAKRSQFAGLPAGTGSMAGTGILPVELADGTIVGVTLTQLKASLALLP